MPSYIAIDIGASSGRHIVLDGSGNLTEVYRFKTGFERVGNSLICDHERLAANVIEGIRLAFERFHDITSLAVDTWGVDYVLLEGGTGITPVYSYRDGRTAAMTGIVHKTVPFEKLYERTGIQFQSFNTLYQLYADKLSGRLGRASDFLMLPEYINYRLTGKKVKEYTNATTTGLVNVSTREFDKEIIAALGLPERLFPRLHEAGEKVGDLLPEIQNKVGGNLAVRLCLSHDTASAVYGIPFEKGERAPYISSGTWSLLGITEKSAHTDEKSRKANYSNEGGIDRTFRYQKNITGMWAVNRAAEELGTNAIGFTALAKESDYSFTVDLNHPDFNDPESFVGTIKRKLEKAGSPALQNAGDIASCVFHSLALLYKNALGELEDGVGQSFERLYIVGGGAKNQLLNELTEKYTGKKVIALPIEATALGNLRIQKEAEEK